MEDRKEKVYKIVMLIFITAVVTFMCTSIGLYNYFTKTSDGLEFIGRKVQISESTNSLQEKIEIVKAMLKEYYKGDIDETKLQESAIKGYVDGLDDTYTEYLTKDEYSELLVNVTGDYVGIGIYMSSDKDGNILVLMPMEGSPAEEAGLQTGDIITKINGESCSNMDTNIASSKIKGEAGTKVTLEVKRDTEVFEVEVERRTVNIKDSSSSVLDGNIGYITLTTFDTGCAENITKYLKEFQDKGIKNVILDLRDNTGGIVDEAIELSELFIKRGDVIMRSFNKDNEETVVKSNNTKPLDIKLVVLVNEYSASATEIVTAALKDNKAATIIGTKTYGKGVMQEIMPLFNGALKVTVEEFVTPNGDKIQKTGIKPDIEVQNDKTASQDAQLEKAIEELKK